jgi:hypothetical protein
LYALEILGFLEICVMQNTYRSIHEGLFFTELEPCTGLKISLETPLYPFLSLFPLFTLYNSWPPFINISTDQIDSYIIVIGEATLVT